MHRTILTAFKRKETVPISLFQLLWNFSHDSNVNINLIFKVPNSFNSLPSATFDVISECPLPGARCRAGTYQDQAVFSASVCELLETFKNDSNL